jgi:hypothetical protein
LAEVLNGAKPGIPVLVHYYRKRSLFRRAQWWAQTAYPESGEVCFATPHGYNNLQDLLDMVDRHFPDTISIED